MDIQYSPYNESIWPDPWPTYKRMQEEAPAYFIEDLDCWALSRFDDIWNASMDRKSYTATHGTSPDALFLTEAPPPRVFLFLDPPQHAQHRNLIARPYMKDKIALIDGFIRDIVRRRLKKDMKEGELELYGFSSQVALEVIAAFIGLELDEVLKIRSFINRFHVRESGARGTTPDGMEAFMAAREYILGLIGKYRQRLPAEHSHLTAWLTAELAEGQMDDDQMFFNIFAMVITGSDTLPLTTAACIYYLNKSPEQLAMVRNDPALIADAFEETARYDQPTNMLGRRLAVDVELHGQTMKKGQSVLFLYAAACRDAREFENPDQFDIRRKQKRNLSFGTGLHFCLGQHLARLEGRIIIEEIFANIPDFEVLEGKCQRVFGEFLQGFSSVPIRFPMQ